jgi:hypothetical protein
MTLSLDCTNILRILLLPTEALLFTPTCKQAYGRETERPSRRKAGRVKLELGTAQWLRNKSSGGS